MGRGPPYWTGPWGTLDTYCDRVTRYRVGVLPGIYGTETLGYCERCEHQCVICSEDQCVITP